MYALSSQRRYWTFGTETEIDELRQQQNQNFISKATQGRDIDESNLVHIYLTPSEEKVLLKSYELHLRDFCRRFEPPMPKCIVGTAFHYFKRFYLNNSTMDYHPKEILATCVYLSCKTEEFNVSISQFVSNIKGDKQKAMDIILSNELLLMQQLNYYLTVHNPFRPIEGFLIDIKTRCSLPNPERLRAGIDDFIDKTFLTDACLLYAPSQLALAAVLHSASKEQLNLDSYVTECLFQNAKDKLQRLIEAVRKIRSMVKTIEQPDKTFVRSLEKKLDQCRNQENNPNSLIYKQRMQKMLDDEDDIELGLGSSVQLNVNVNATEEVHDASMLSVDLN